MCAGGRFGRFFVVHFSDNSTSRLKRHGYPPVPAVPAAVPAAPVGYSYPAYAPRAPAFSSYSYAPSYPSYSYSYSPAVQSYQPIQAAPQTFVQPIQALPPARPVFIQPIPERPLFIEPTTQWPEVLPRYPLPGCYNDSSFFLCCNCELESLMERTYWDFRREQPSLSNGNVQLIANRIQRNAEQMFGESFEIVVGLGDFATRSHFYKDLLCKIEREGRYMIAYATPQEEAEYFEESRGGFNPVWHGVQHKSIKHCDAHTSANLNRELFMRTINPYTFNKYASVGDRWQNLAFKWRI